MCIFLAFCVCVVALPSRRCRRQLLLCRLFHISERYVWCIFELWVATLVCMAGCWIALTVFFVHSFSCAELVIWICDLWGSQNFGESIFFWLKSWSLWCSELPEEGAACACVEKIGFCITNSGCFNFAKLVATILSFSAPFSSLWNNGASLRVWAILMQVCVFFPRSTSRPSMFVKQILANSRNRSEFHTIRPPFSPFAASSASISSTSSSFASFAGGGDSLMVFWFFPPTSEK